MPAAKTKPGVVCALIRLCTKNLRSLKSHRGGRLVLRHWKSHIYHNMHNGHPGIGASTLEEKEASRKALTDHKIQHMKDRHHPMIYLAR